MFTDIYFTNLAPTAADTDICFYQNTSKVISLDTPLKTVSGCQYNWCHKFRIPWDLCFCLIKSSGNNTEPYCLSSLPVYNKKKTLISKEGIVSVIQDYHNGKQVSHFEQTKGNAYSGVQLYRGKLLVGTQLFTQNRAQIDLDTTIFFVENRLYNSQQNRVQENNTTSVLSFDFAGLKAVHLFLIQNKGKRELAIRKIEQW